MEYFISLIFSGQVIQMYLKNQDFTSQDLYFRIEDIEQNQLRRMAHITEKLSNLKAIHKEKIENANQLCLLL